MTKFRLAKSATTTLSAQRAELQRRNTKFACRRMALRPMRGCPNGRAMALFRGNGPGALSVFAAFFLG